MALIKLRPKFKQIKYLKIVVFYKETQQQLHYRRIHEQLQYSNISNENRNDFLHGNSRYIRDWSLSEQEYIADVFTVRKKLSLFSVTLKIWKLIILYLLDMCTCIKSLSGRGGKILFFGIPSNYIATAQLFGNYKCNCRVVTVFVTTSYH